MPGSCLWVFEPIFVERLLALAGARRFRAAQEMQVEREKQAAMAANDEEYEQKEVFDSNCM